MLLVEVAVNECVICDKDAACKLVDTVVIPSKALTIILPLAAGVDILIVKYIAVLLLN